MSNTAGILLYGHDELLLATRGMIFKLAGFQVRTAKTLDEFSRMLEERLPDLIVLCYSAPRNECVAVCMIAKNRAAEMPTMQLVTTIAFDSRDGEMNGIADAIFDAMLDPEALVAKSKSMLPSGHFRLEPSRHDSGATAPLRV
jgi:DNA-binding response OmpR family regulator